MAYNKDIPQPTDRIKASQNDILQNFQSINTVVSVDHVTFDAASGNQGKHNTVSMPNYVGGAASPVAVADEIKLFTKAVAGVTQLFVLPEAGDTLLPERNITGATRGFIGETTLPSGIKLKWGNDSTVAGLLTVTFASTFTELYNLQLSISTVGGTNATGIEDVAIRSYQIGNADFKVVTYRVSLFASGTRQASPFQWFAIGR